MTRKMAPSLMMAKFITWKYELFIAVKTAKVWCPYFDSWLIKIISNIWWCNLCLHFTLNQIKMALLGDWAIIELKRKYSQELTGGGVLKSYMIQYDPGQGARCTDSTSSSLKNNFPNLRSDMHRLCDCNTCNRQLS